MSTSMDNLLASAIAYAKDSTFKLMLDAYTQTDIPEVKSVSNDVDYDCSSSKLSKSKTKRNSYRVSINSGTLNNDKTLPLLLIRFKNNHFIDSNNNILEPVEFMNFEIPKRYSTAEYQTFIPIGSTEPHFKVPLRVVRKIGTLDNFLKDPFIKKCDSNVQFFATDFLKLIKKADRDHSDILFDNINKLKPCNVINPLDVLCEQSQSMKNKKERTIRVITDDGFYEILSSREPIWKEFFDKFRKDNIKIGNIGSIEPNIKNLELNKDQTVISSMRPFKIECRTYRITCEGQKVTSISLI